MGAWIKFFEDGSSEHGHDLEIKNKTASWSQGKLSDIAKVQISERMNEALLSIPKTEWHQFDRYEALISGIGKAESTRVARVIQAKIGIQHLGMYLCYNIKDQRFLWANISSCPPELDGSQEHIKITDVFLNKWISICISSTKKGLLWVGERGKLNGNKQISR